VTRRAKGRNVLEIVNETPFGIAAIPAIDRNGDERLVVCVAARYALPPAGRAFADAPPLHAEQSPPQLEDSYVGEPGRSSLEREGQAAYVRPAADLYVRGTAWTARGQPAIAVGVGIELGDCSRQIAVIGARRWVSSLVGVRASQPEPFTSLPLCYEQSFGGPAPSSPLGQDPAARPHPANPVGCGHYRNAREAMDQPLPRIEDPAALIRGLGDRPAPVGLGPIARHWEPRRKLCGTYDAAWQRDRAPLWPPDFDERFFHAAPPGLRIPFPRGGEPLRVTGLSPDGPRGCCLPTNHLELAASSRRPARRLALDALEVDGDAGVLTLIYRTSLVVADGAPPAFERLSVREVES